MGKAEDQYKKVRARIAKGKGVVESIREVAQEQGLAAGSVQTNYYKIHRAQATKGNTSNGNAPVMERATPPGRENDPTDSILNNIMGEVRKLVQRNRELEAEHERLAQIERILTQ